MAVNSARLWQSARQRLDSRTLVLGIPVILVAFLVLVPLGMLLYSSFSGARPGDLGALTLNNYIKAYSRPSTYQLLLNSLIFATGSCILTFLMGTALAWFCERTDMPWRGLFYTLSVVRLLIPGVLGTIAWIFLLSPRVGLINLFLKEVFGLEEAPFDIFSLWGMIWVESVLLFPLTFLIMSAAFRAMDPSLEESATMSGSSTFSTFRRVTLRLMAPAIFSTLLIMFIRGLESFEVPALVGMPSRIFVFVSAIYTATRYQPIDYGMAGALSVSILIISAIGVFVYGRLTRRSEQYSTVTGKGFRPRSIELGRWRYVMAGIFALFFFITVGLPILILMWYSLLPFFYAPSAEALAQVSLDNYVKVLQWPKARQTFINSGVAAFGTATIVMLLTSLISWIVVKTRLPGRSILDSLAFMPIAIPGLIVGVSLMWVYLTFSIIPIYGTIWILMVAYVTRFMPYGIRTTSAAMVQIHKELEEASMASGATWLQTFRKVTLPLLRPAFLAGWIYVAIISIRELSSSILLYAPGSEVFSILVWDLWEDGAWGRLSAVGIFMIFGLGLLVFLLQKLGGRMDRF